MTSKAKPWSAVKAKMPAARRKKIEARGKALHREYLTFKQLREARKLTQVAVAEKLEIAQGGVARIEQRSDMLFSTMQGYVEALGGSLVLTAEFPDGAAVTLAGLGELDDEPDKAPEKERA